MSVSKFAYEPWKCDGEFCIGDCNICYKAEIEQDGWVTWNDLSDTQKSVSGIHTGKDDSSKHSR